MSTAAQVSDRVYGQLTAVAMGGAALMLAHQIAAKAARDGLFLANFPPSDLPKIVTAAAIVAMAFGLLFARWISRHAPANLMPLALALSAGLHVAEFLALDNYRSTVVVLIYFHIVGFGAILLSGFWSVVSEAFDPREAKLRFGRIAGAGTFGGISGGLLAERCAALYSVDALLVLLAGLHACSAVALTQMRRTMVASQPLTPAEPHAPLVSTARAAFRATPFLSSLAIMVLLGTMSATLLDYLFKAGATANYGKGPMLTRYFALFYTLGQVLTFLVQTFLTPAVLQNLGLGRAVMTLPGAVAAGAAAALYIPVFPMIAGVRLLELTLRGSFFRSGYEIFFTPIPPRQKRAVKTIIDVGCDRFGDAFGAVMLQLLLMHEASRAPTQILLFAAAIGALTIWITSRMDKAYLAVLEQGLLNRAIELKDSDVLDATTRSAMLGTVSVRTPRPQPVNPQEDAVPLVEDDSRMSDQTVKRLADLRSGNLTRVMKALEHSRPFDPIVIPQVVRLLAWNEATERAREFLVDAGERVVGQLTDVLVDRDQEFAVRRRVPRILARSRSQRAVDGLLDALSDPRFEIRFQVSRALDYMHQENGHLHFSRSVIIEAVERELSVSRPIWDGRRLLDTREVTDSHYAFLDDLLQERADQSLENVFSLLAVLYPREPLRVAFRALHSEDRHLRGLALEYLEGSLPTHIFEQLANVLEGGPATPSGRSKDEVLNELMSSQQSLMVQLRKASEDVASVSGSVPRTTTN